MNVIKVKNLTVPRPSNDWNEKLKISLRAFAGSGDPIEAALYDESWAGRQASHCVYSVGLQTIKNLPHLNEINKPLCWRFIAGGHRNVPTADGCWATHEMCGGPPKVMATLRSREMADILADSELLNGLTHLTGHPNDQYELRILRVPGLCLEAFWLKCVKTKKDDLIVPYGLVLNHTRVKLGGGKSLEKNKVYHAPEFLKIVGEAARRRLAAEHNRSQAHRAGA